MGAFDISTLLPCPPAYTDYAAITPGTFDPDTPAACSLNTLYRTQSTIDVGSLFSVLLVAGRQYRVGCEGSFTQESLQGAIIYIKYWAPSAWDDDIDDTETDSFVGEDELPYWCPYTSKLNETAGGLWYGGQRGEFTALETGTYVFYFLEYSVK